MLHLDGMEKFVYASTVLTLRANEAGLPRAVLPTASRLAQDKPLYRGRGGYHRRMPGVGGRWVRALTRRGA